VHIIRQYFKGVCMKAHIYIHAYIKGNSLTLNMYVTSFSNRFYGNSFLVSNSVFEIVFLI